MPTIHCPLASESTIANGLVKTRGPRYHARMSMTDNNPADQQFTPEPKSPLMSSVMISQSPAAPMIQQVHGTTMCVEKGTPPKVIGIALTGDELSHCNALKNALNLGVVVIQSLEISVTELRKHLENDLPSLPPNFSFCTKEGWPISLSQEKYMRTSQLTTDKSLITIRRTFDTPRIGILIPGGECLGFIFIELKSCLTTVRKAIGEQLQENSRPKFEYRFRDRHGWPVQSHQESILLLLDLLVDNNVCIEYSGSIAKIPDRPNDHPSHGDAILRSKAQDTTDGRPPSRENKSIKFPWERKSTIKKSGPNRDDLTAKPILISYVRQEAAQHALNLKNELTTSGFSVYLDVHEIKTGTDWQDALNYAVRHCYVFVPLITPMYGKTQWTNREVKLADTLRKIIIPINFLDYWPPECLAIQFASTQYIPWKPADPNPSHVNNETTGNDPYHWDPMHIQQVAKQIADRCRSAINAMRQSRMIIERSVPSPKKIAPRTVSFRDHREEKLSAPETVDSNVAEEPQVELLKKPEPTKPLVVISAHPKQTLMAHQVKTELEKEYDVWCSTELLEAHVHESDYELPSNPNTPRELPTIPESGESVFEGAYNQVVTSIESKRASVRDHDGPVKPPLQRMISQASEISQVSSLTPDKMEKLRLFQQKADNAAVVIILASEAYAKSTTCHQQIYYCEHRKKMILVNVDNSKMPRWFTMLVGNDMIGPGGKMMQILKGRVKRAVDPSSSETPKDATNEAKVQYLVKFLKQKLPPLEQCVYVVGSSKLENEKTTEICKAIGRELAKSSSPLTIVTGGYSGAPDIVARSFFEARENNRTGLSGDSAAQNSSVVHILPIKDGMDLSSKTTQNSDGSFEPLHYGNTVFAGDSVKERESAVARLLDTCIVIEGGPGAAHEVEEFIWNDHFVIPIKSTGGAAEGNFGVPMKIFEAPPGVAPTDWATLSEKHATPETIAQAVARIVVSLKKSVISHSMKDQNEINLTRTKGKKWRSRKSKKNKESKPKEITETIESFGISKEQTLLLPEQNGGSRESFSEEHQFITIQTCPTPRDRKPIATWRKLLNTIRSSSRC